MWAKVTKGLSLFALCVGVMSAAQAQTPSSPYSYARSSTFSYRSDGLLSAETIEPDDAQSCVATTYAYDAYGNKSVATAANCSGATGNAVFSSRSSTTTYPSAVTAQNITVSGANVSVAEPAGLFPIRASNALGQQETRQFDPRFGAVLQVTGPNGLTTSWILDDFGRKVRERRADGTSTVFAYCVLSSSGLDTSSNSATCPAPTSGEVPADSVSFIHSEARDANDAKMGAFTRVYSDRLGRQIRALTESFDGSSQPSSRNAVLVVVDTVYSVYGAKQYQTQPYFLSSASSTVNGTNDVGVTRTDYDVLGRPVTIYIADSNGSASAISFGNYGVRQATVQTLSYSGLTTTAINDKEQVHVEEKNALGELVRVTDASGAQIAYQHDAFGNLLATRDPLQNTVAMSYDIRGRKLSLTDPDAGLSQYDYDALGQLVWQQNAVQRANGSSTTMLYDVLGRLIRRTDPEYTSTWSYDANADGSACPRGVGKLCETYTSHGVSRKWVYDAYGRVINARTSVTNGVSAATAVAYDATTGRVVSQTYPTGVKIGYAYTARGFSEKLTLLTAATVSSLPAAVGGAAGAPASLPSGTVLWQAQSVNAWGKAEQQYFGNGVTGKAAYDALNGRTTGLTAGVGGSTSVMNQSFTWDSLGNMMARADANGDGSTGAVTETFTYGDSLNRLTGYTVASNSIPNLARSVSMQYNALGMLLYKSDVGSYSYTASGAGVVQPHALRSLTNASGTTTYSYDTNGNLVNASAGKYRSIAYTSFNLPDSNTGLVGPNGTPDYLWQYDENRARIKEVRTVSGGVSAGTRTIWYFNPDNQGGLSFESEVNSPTAASAANPSLTTNRHYLSIGGQTIGVLVSTGSLPTLASTQTAPAELNNVAFVKVEYWHRDHLGSLIATTDHAAGITGQYSYDPFGKRRFVTGAYDQNGVVVVDWSSTTSGGSGRGFTGHQQLDDVGLVHMNGRIYDPTLGAFLQADPVVQNPNNLQSYNRYGYCYNNPMGCSDPSGYCFMGCFWHDPIVRVAIAMVVAYYTGYYYNGYAAGTILEGGTPITIGGSVSFTASAVSGFAAGAVLTGSVEGALKGAAGGALFYEVGDFLNGSGAFSNFWSDGQAPGEIGAWGIGVHAVAGCVQGTMNGAKCGSSALSAAFSQAALPYGSDDMVGGTISSMVIGGAASVLGGGKFANGAETAAFGYLFNYCSHDGNCTTKLEKALWDYMPGYQVGTCINNGDCTAADWVRAATGTAFAVFGGIEVRGAGAAAEFFAGSTYTSKVLGQMGVDVYHGFPVAIDSLAAEAGQVTRIVGGDGATYLRLRVDGAVNGVKGVFEYIKDSAGNINHRLFVPSR